MSRTSLLADIQAGAIDDSVSLGSLLQKCIALGGQAGSVKLQDWARSELNGYISGPREEFPDYRKVPAQLTASIGNAFGLNQRPQEIFEHEIPETVRGKRPDWSVAELGNGVGELEALANSAQTMVNLSPPWASEIVRELNAHNKARSVVMAIYWPLSTSTLHGVLSRIRTALVELVTELADLTPDDQVVPAREAADQVVQFVISGDRNVITYSPQIANDQGTNTYASGDHATGVGNQSVTGDNNTTAGRNATAPLVQPAERDGWWKRLRKRGLFVALFTVVAGVIAVLTYLGLAPSSSPTNPPAPTTPVSSTTGAQVGTTSR